MSQSCTVLRDVKYQGAPTAYSVPRGVAASPKREVRKGILQQRLLPDKSSCSAPLSSRAQWGVDGVSC